MKRVLVFALVLCLLLCACTPKPEQTQVPTTAAPTGAPVDTDFAQTFSDSQQDVLALSVGNQSAGTQITLKDADGNILISYAPELNFAVVILSTPEMVKGENYTIYVGTQSGTFAAN